MGRPRVYPDDFRHRAVGLVREWRDSRGGSDGAVTHVAKQLGLHRETLRRWIIEEEIESGTRAGVSRDERSRVAELEREEPRAAPSQRDPEISCGFLRGGSSTAD